MDVGTGSARSVPKWIAFLVVSLFWAGALVWFGIFQSDSEDSDLATTPDAVTRVEAADQSESLAEPDSTQPDASATAQTPVPETAELNQTVNNAESPDQAEATSDSENPDALSSVAVPDADAASNIETEAVDDATADRQADDTDAGLDTDARLDTDLRLGTGAPGDETNDSSDQAAGSGTENSLTTNTSIAPAGNTAAGNTRPATTPTSTAPTTARNAEAPNQTNSTDSSNGSQATSEPVTERPTEKEPVQPTAETATASTSTTTSTTPPARQPTTPTPANETDEGNSQATSNTNTNTTTVPGLFADSSNTAALWAAANPTDPRADVIANQIGNQPIAKWFGEWSGDITSAVSSYVGQANTAGDVPVLVAYNIPDRDCGQHSAGGATSFAGYSSWIDGFARGLGNGPAIIIVEPDALALNDCGGSERNDAMAAAVSKIKQACEQCRVYLDAGHSDWVRPTEMANRLFDAGVMGSDGFFTNVSNYNTTASEQAFGSQVLSALGGPTGLGQVIDVSRNGNGANGEWCDPDGRAIGSTPTLVTGTSTVHAHLWIKVPGEADGCASGAGNFVPELAFELATNAGRSR